MGSINIPILSTDDDAEIIWKAVKEITSNLLENYSKKGILQFIPFHRSTYDWKNEILEAGTEMEVYYYHETFAKLKNVLVYCDKNFKFILIICIVFYLLH
ncbi:MAG: hypothetical protein HPY79_05885 [Bacteroidales bacterium]|nr:hypothetical protein [Bacteroidales bacterium]